MASFLAGSYLPSWWGKWMDLQLLSQKHLSLEPIYYTILGKLAHLFSELDFKKMERVNL